MEIILKRVQSKQKQLFSSQGSTNQICNKSALSKNLDDHGQDENTGRSQIIDEG